MSVPVNDRVRVEPGRDGEIVVMAAWCGKCKCEVMPVRGGECSWCGLRIVDESQLSARAMLEQLRNGDGPVLEEAAADMGPDAVSSSSESGPAEPAPSPEGEPEPAGGGARYRPPVKWTRERCIEAIREVAAKVGHTPSRAEMKEAGYISVTVSSTTLARLETTWEGLLREAGFDPEDTGQAARSAPATREGNTAARPAESEREPAAVDPPDHPVAPLAPAGAKAASRSDVDQILELLRVLELLDGTPCDCDRGRRYASVIVWKDGSGEDDAAAEALFRRLLCQELISHSPEDIACAVLKRLDAFETAAA